MDVILKVLEGAKTGTKIAIKKERFLIGRSQQCNLCAGSSSISRQHCVIKRNDTQVSIKDLGSRNGTVVNGKKITRETEIKSGDEIGIGTLKLVVTISHGINNLKRPKVNSVAEAVDRTADVNSSSVVEDDITKWLLDAPGPSSGSGIAASETQTMRMDDTNAVNFKSVTHRVDEAADESTAEEAKQTPDENASENEDETADASTDESPKSKKKKEPGKLPKLPSEPESKDSREAAMNALRNWNRRR